MKKIRKKKIYFVKTFLLNVYKKSDLDEEKFLFLIRIFSFTSVR